ncbi:MULTISPECIES: GIY-YIG nuclease family protein [unclassified Bacillus (in: firmicutes)]|uniref:GIY-YIG nuclease family protein n=1 Tax=unclassified Bacillus (in: firmicutes) TaxID=185979 RepID=UPI0023DBDA30|nr:MULTISPECIES: GIY-YIG nuclease family protein [unclassified Bacillus (in: firmicutes)]MCU4759364.1 GIY-YIG nuclease family protein [Bacillus cereus]MDF2016461.1 GIY-YIG nuclease family protein [Bacillus sp. Cr_R3]MDF2033715.1 GIY-YIG nuclease family protein [Bacillus sp. Cr_R16]
MFGTIIQDAYTKDETNQIVEALEDLCNPSYPHGWSSAGIYCFWDYTTKEVLYIGLARDLLERFKQHNGIIRVDPKGCKIKKIEEYFQSKQKLGYSIFVQSPMHQPFGRKNKGMLGRYTEEQFPFAQYPIDDIKVVEGILIECFKKKHGDLPPWNRVGGSTNGQAAATDGNYILIESLTHPNITPLIARYTLREIYDNSTYLAYEEYLHAVRMLMLMLSISFNEALEQIKLTDSITYQRIIDAKYLHRKLTF